MDQASCEAMAGKLQIYGDGVATAELLLMKYQSPDEHELAPTVHPFASLREIFIRVHSCPFAVFLRLLILPPRPLCPLREARFFYS
jgi:hypothetical protein